jgi:heme/copper-type cytochrome/quinol oxidase subunit 2
MYVLSLSANYGFTTYKDLDIGDKINGYSLNWALGYMINELNRDDFLPYEATPRKLSLSLFLTFTIVISLVMVLVIGSLVYKRFIARRKKVDEQVPLNKYVTGAE